jgi:hypothetical protein
MNATSTCPACGASVRVGARFCGSCGQTLGVDAPAAAASAPSLPVHAVAAPGLQTFAQPDAASAPGSVLPGGASVEILEVRAAWANVRDGSGRTAWVDGRRLVPPTAVEYSSAYAAPTTAPRPTATGVGPDAIIGLVGAIGVIVGSLLNWVGGGSGSDFSSFKLPVGFLFDNTNTSQDPKTGYFLIAVAVIGLVCSFIPKTEWVRILCGVIAVGAPVLYAIQLNENLQRYSSYGSYYSKPDLTDLLGPGVWVTGIAGLVLAISPAFRRRQ